MSVIFHFVIPLKLQRKKIKRRGKKERHVLEFQFSFGSKIAVVSRIRISRLVIHDVRLLGILDVGLVLFFKSINKDIVCTIYDLLHSYTITLTYV